MEIQDHILGNGAMNKSANTEIETVRKDNYRDIVKLQDAAVLLREAILKCNEILQTHEMDLHVSPQPRYEVDCEPTQLESSNKITRDNKEVQQIQFAYSSTS